MNGPADSRAAAAARVAKKYPIGRLGDPTDIASAVAFPCSEESSFMAGSEMVVGGGVTCG